MIDYSDSSMPLTARSYVWSATLLCGPPRSGANPSKDRAGSYTPPPGATVGTLLEGIRAVHARERGIPVREVLLVCYSIRDE